MKIHYHPLESSTQKALDLVIGMCPLSLISRCFFFQAIIKNLAFLQRTRITGNEMRYIPIATWIILKYTFSTRGESNPNYIGFHFSFQVFGQKLCLFFLLAKNKRHQYFSSQNFEKISSKLCKINQSFSNGDRVNNLLTSCSFFCSRIGN